MIRLSDISEDDIDHVEEHAVLERVTSILNDGDDVGSDLGEVDKITARTVRELDGVDEASLHMRRRGTGIRDQRYQRRERQ